MTTVASINVNIVSWGVLRINGSFSPKNTFDNYLQKGGPTFFSSLHIFSSSSFDARCFSTVAFSIRSDDLCGRNPTNLIKAALYKTILYDWQRNAAIKQVPTGKYVKRPAGSVTCRFSPYETKGRETRVISFMYTQSSYVTDVKIIDQFSINSFNREQRISSIEILGRSVKNHHYGRTIGISLY